MVHLLSRRFFSRPSPIVAKDMIGKILVRRLNDVKLLRGSIVETEAYGGLKDPASHAFRGMTPRNKIMFGKAGFSYVYFTYGFHHCLNVVTGKEGSAQAVLIRALEPLSGQKVMRRFRGSDTKIQNMTNGPGKICQALAINRSLSELDVTRRDSPIFFEVPSNQDHFRRKISCGPRIGINVGTEKLWRFYDASSIYVSHRSNVNVTLKQRLRFSRP